jgi:hypothetical protein
LIIATCIYFDLNLNAIIIKLHDEAIYIYIYRDIQERDDIIIKPADKGSAVVVMDKTIYIQEAERHLSDCRFYEKLDSDPPYYQFGHSQFAYTYQFGYRNKVDSAMEYLIRFLTSSKLKI